MNEIKIFENESFGKVRVAGTSEEPLFCLADVCAALDLVPSKVAQRLGDGVLSKYPIVDSLGREQQANFVNEEGLYDAIFDSRKPEAKQFRKWVTSEVLPSIRKNGGYVNDSSIFVESFFEDLDDTAKKILIETLDSRKKLLEENKKQEKQIGEMSIKMSKLEKKSDYLDIILQSKETVTVTQIAQDYGMSAKAFNKVLANLGVQHKVNGQWILYAKYLGEGYVHSKTVSITRSNGEKDTVMNTEWKQKGRIFLYNLLKENGYLPLIEKM